MRVLGILVAGLAGALIANFVTLWFAASYLHWWATAPFATPFDYGPAMKWAMQQQARYAFMASAVGGVGIGAAYGFLFRKKKEASA
jgi:hypothetical protein